MGGKLPGRGHSGGNFQGEKFWSPSITIKNIIPKLGHSSKILIQLEDITKFKDKYYFQGHYPVSTVKAQYPSSSKKKIKKNLIESRKKVLRHILRLRLNPKIRIHAFHQIIDTIKNVITSFSTNKKENNF